MRAAWGFVGLLLVIAPFLAAVIGLGLLAGHRFGDVAGIVVTALGLFGLVFLAVYFAMRGVFDRWFE